MLSGAAARTARTATWPAGSRVMTSGADGGGGAEGSCGAALTWTCSQPMSTRHAAAWHGRLMSFTGTRTIPSQRSLV